MSQNTISLPTTGTISGLDEQHYINNALATLNSKWSGASAPATPTPVVGQSWLDTSTTPNTLRIYDGAQWLAVATIDATNHVLLPTPSLVTGLAANTTLTAADAGKTFTSGAVGVTATLPALASVPDGAEFGFQAQNVTFTIAADGSEKIYGPNNWGVSSIALTNVGDELRLKKQASTGWIVINRTYLLASTADAQAGTNGSIAMTPYAFAGAALGSPGQSWHDVTGSRALGTVYTNSTGRPIVVEVGVYNTTGGELEIINGGVTRGYAGGAAGIRDIVTTVVRAGDTYEFAVVSGAFSMTSWAELS